MESKAFKSQESIILKSRYIIKSFEIYKDYLLLGTEKGWCEIFNWKKEKPLQKFNFYYKDKEMNDLIFNSDNHHLLDNSLQIINLGIIISFTDNNFSEESQNIYFFAQSRKGDFFICYFDNKLNENCNINKVEFLYKIESNNETFCKFIFIEKNVFCEGCDFLLFLPSEIENNLNVFTLNCVEAGNIDKIKFNDQISKDKLATKNFEKYVFEFITEFEIKSKNIDRIIENKAELIQNFEENEYDGQKIEDHITFNSENGLISCMEKTSDGRFLILGTESLNLIALELKPKNYSNENEKICLDIVSNYDLKLFCINNQDQDNLASSDINSILAIKVIDFMDKLESKNLPNTDFKILIGMYSTTIVVLGFNTKSKIFENICQIKNACNIQKPGISSIDYIQFKINIKDELEEMEMLLLEENEEDKSNITHNIANQKFKNVNFLCTGSYDYKIRLFEFFEKNNFFDCLGSFYNGANNIIHKVKFLCQQAKSPQESDTLLLFVASDQKLFHIYTIV